MSPTTISGLSGMPCSKYAYKRWKPKYFKVLTIDTKNISQPKVSTSILKTELDGSTD
jgi:hypothetical protein